MLNEPSANSETPIIELPSPVDDLRSQLRAAVDEVFFVEFENDDLPAPMTATYTGRLLIDSMAAYDKIDAAFAHRLHQRQHVAARDAEAARDAGRFQRGDDEVRVVHGARFFMGIRSSWLRRALCHTSEPSRKLLRSASIAQHLGNFRQ